MNKLRSLLQAIGILPKTAREPFYTRVLRALPTLLVVTAIMFGLEMLGWLRGFETAAIDGLLLAKRTPAPSQIVIVTIDDEDYRTLFNGKSPVDPQALDKLLSAIAAGKPAVIGVDLDTTSPTFASRQWPEAVWARDADPEIGPDDAGSSTGSHPAPESLVRLPVLGGSVQETFKDGLITTVPASGLVVFPRDFDGVIRRYRREFESNKSEPPSTLHGEVDTLPWAVVKQYVAWRRANQEEPCLECDRVEKLEGAGKVHELVLNFAGDRYHFDRIAARHVLAGSEKTYWANNAPVRDAIVLVGGAYRAARDEYVTPVGSMFGVELIAQAIESDLRGGGIREVNRITAMALELAMSMFLLYVNWRFPGRYTAAISIVTIIVLSFLGSFLAFNALAYWFNFTAVLVSMWIHALWEQSKDRRELRHEVDTLKGELAALKGQDHA